MSYKGQGEMSLSLGVEENDQDPEDDDKGWEEEEGHKDWNHIAGGFFTSYERCLA